MIEDAFSDNFTLFVLGVSIVLSFVLRKLINEIQLIKDSYSKDLILFTKKIVDQNPSLEHFYQIALLFYKDKNYLKSHEYFEKLIGEGVFEREAKFYLILTLVELGRLEDAKNILSTLDLTLYSKKEVQDLTLAVRKSRSFLRLKEWMLNVLLTRVPLQLSYSKDLVSSKEVQIVGALPTRYSNTTLKYQNEDAYIFDAIDQHLNRDVELWVYKSDESVTSEAQFLELPKILANLHSRSFPEVYDLQQGSLVFYSREKFEGESFFEYLNTLEKTQKFSECFSLWISLFSQLEFLELNGLCPENLDFQLLGYHSKKDCIFIFQKLLLSNQKDTTKVLLKIQNSFIDYMNKMVSKFPSEFELLAKYVDRIDFSGCNLKQSIYEIEGVLQEYLKGSRSDIKDLLQQLDLLEEIHRSCIHGLKGKFSVYQRYVYDPQKLLQTFFRELNVKDVDMKMKHLIVKVTQLANLPKLQSFSLTEELLAVDFEKLLQRMHELQSNMDSMDGAKAAQAFLQAQSSFFTNLSEACSNFFKDHEYDLEDGIMELIKLNTERDNIQVHIDPKLISKKIRVIHKSQFEDEICLLFDNALNNSFEAGSKTVNIHLKKKSAHEIQLQILDDGPGVDEDLLKDLHGDLSYQLGDGGTGLIAIRNSCNIIGAQLDLKNMPNSGLCLSVDLPSFRN
ncbi:MAG: sensor histidine kinase [Candidatus Cloacimonetes bacterium]|nr:sensor histidine kinase [Candidatus Cloacimonadota bacterium]